MSHTNALSSPDGTYCLLRVPVLPPTSIYAAPCEYLLPTSASSTSRPAQRSTCDTVLWAALPQPNPFPAAILCLSMTTQVKQWSKRLAVAEFVHFTYRGITSCRKRSVPKIGDIQTTLSGIGSRSTDSILAMEPCARTTGSSN